jgi:hypothetical protein
MTVIFEKFQRALIPQLCDGDHALSRIGQPHNHMVCQKSRASRNPSDLLQFAVMVMISSRRSCPTTTSSTDTEAPSLRKLCQQLRWAVVSDTATVL